MKASIVPDLTPRQSALTVCVLFTVLTALTSTMALLQGEATDTHLHLLTRLAVTIVGVSTFHIFGVLRRRLGATMSAGATYAAAMALVFAMVWTSGHFQELHPDAYRDSSLNFTAVYVAVAAVLGLTSWWRQRRTRPHAVTNG